MIIVQYSGGIGSWGAAKRAVAQYGKENVKLLFADTKMEDEDLYRFLNETVQELGCELIKLEDGRTPWQVFNDVRFLGNSRVDPCSKVLKRDLLRKWVNENCNPDNDVICIGIDWTEINRFERAKPRHKPFELWAPLCEPPFIEKDELIKELNDLNIKVPRLYEMGFPHNNCGGFCVKAGQAQFKLLLDKMPERYLKHEQKEQALMKKVITISLITLLLSGCWTTQRGEKHGVLVKLSKEGTLWGTYEGELIRGGINDASGSNGKSFHFSFGQFQSKLTEKGSTALSQNKPVVLGYHCEKFVAPWRGETNCFADSLRVLD